MSEKFLDYSGLKKYTSKIETFIADTLAAFVPNTRTINNKPLSSNIKLTATDVGVPTYFAGLGVNIVESKININNPNRGILSQEEFDALPEENKQTGTYIIIN